MKKTFLTQISAASCEKGCRVIRLELTSNDTVVYTLQPPMSKDKIRYGFICIDLTEYVKVPAMYLDLPESYLYRARILKRDHKVFKVFIASFYSKGVEIIRLDNVEGNAHIVSYDLERNKIYILPHMEVAKWFPHPKK